MILELPRQRYIIVTRNKRGGKLGRREGLNERVQKRLPRALMMDGGYFFSTNIFLIGKIVIKHTNLKTLTVTRFIIL